MRRVRAATERLRLTAALAPVATRQPVAPELIGEGALPLRPPGSGTSLHELVARLYAELERERLEDAAWSDPAHFTVASEPPHQPRPAMRLTERPGARPGGVEASPSDGATDAVPAPSPIADLSKREPAADGSSPAGARESGVTPEA